MIKQLTHYTIGTHYGFDQDWYPDFAMNKGGCAATVAAESCLLFKKCLGIDTLYPYDAENVTFDDFNRFAMTIKPYIRPRIGGVDRLSLYINGFGKYLRDCGETRISMEGFPGDASEATAKETLIAQIDLGLPVPFLLLAHQDQTLYDFIWHWFLLNGYDRDGESLRVKAATFGEWQWLDFDQLWNTGKDKKGGMILYRLST